MSVHVGYTSCDKPKWLLILKACASHLLLLQLEVKMQVEYMSFSAHADAKGIMQLIRQAEPRNVLLVHGEAKKMEFLKQKIEQEFRTYSIGTEKSRKRKNKSFKFP